MPKTAPRRTKFSDFRLDYTPLRRIRRAKFEMTMKEVASAAGIHYSTLARIERGEIRPSHDTLVALARALGVPVRDLYVQSEGDGRE